MVDKTVLYYTCCAHQMDIEMACRRQLLIAKGNLPLVTVSRMPIDFGDHNIVVDEPRSPLTMHKQIQAGLEYITPGGCVFLCESDVLYSPSHFAFTPLKENVFYYNTNVWKVWYEDGLGTWTDNLQQVSGLCASHSVLLDFYCMRVDQIKREGFNRHYEPGPKQAVFKCYADNWMSEYPNLDIRHGKTLTRSKRSPDEFRNKRYARGWKETYGEIPGWGEIQSVLRQVRMASA